MRKLRSHCRCHQLVMSRLIFYLKLILAFPDRNPGSHKRKVHQHIDFIKCHPISDLVPETPEDRLAVMQIGIDQLSVFPRTVFLFQMERHVKMTDGDNRLDSCGQHFVNHILIKFHPLFIRLLFLSCRKDSGPSKGKAVASEAHLCHQCNILFPMMIHINGFVGRVISVFRQRSIIPHPQHNRSAVFSPGDYIHRSESFSSFQISSFALVRGRSAAP